MPRRLVRPLAVLLLLAAAACSQRTTSSAAAPPDAMKRPAEPSIAATPPEPAPPADAATILRITATDGLPAALVAERPVLEAASIHGRPSHLRATRVYRDGSVYGYGAFRRSIVDGVPGQVPAPLAWRLDGRMSKAGLAEVDRRVRERVDNGLLQLAASAPAVALGPDQLAITYRAWVGDREYQNVRVMAPGANHDLPTPMMALDGALMSNIIDGSVPLEQP